MSAFPRRLHPLVMLLPFAVAIASFAAAMHLHAH